MSTLLAEEKKTKKTSGFQNILVAVDPDCETRHLLAMAAAIGRQFHSKVSLLHVIPDDDLELGDPGERAHQRARSEHGVRQCAELMEVHRLPCHTLVEVGDIVREVGKAVRDHNIDLVIVGTAGPKGLKKVRLGSVAEGILRTVTCPVLSLGPKVSPRLGEMEFRKVLFPIAFDVDVHRACIHLEPLLERFGSHVVVLHTLPGGRRFSPQAAEMAAQYQARLEKTLPCKNKHFSADYHVKFGDPAEAILELAHTWEADLIAIPARRGGRLVSHLPGHIAYEVIRQAPCPVMTIRV